ncbi:MAG: hypothetical protein ACJ8AW_01680 [Rhodopila sp.]
MLIGDTTARGWVERLGWRTGVRVQTRDLPPLDRDGVRNLLLHSGAPIDVLAARPDIVRKLYELTEGEPLLLRLYVEDLWTSDDANSLTVEALGRIKPGFGEYFRDWLHRQRDAWRSEDGTQYDSRIIDGYLAILACALGRLTGNDMGEVAQRLLSVSSSSRIENTLRPLRRFVIGTGSQLDDGESGYVLSHPKLSEFLQQEYFEGSWIRDANAAFTDWGAMSCTN